MVVAVAESRQLGEIAVSIVSGNLGRRERAMNSRVTVAGSDSYLVPLSQTLALDAVN